MVEAEELQALLEAADQVETAITLANDVLGSSVPVPEAINAPASPPRLGGNSSLSGLVSHEEINLGQDY